MYLSHTYLSAGPWHQSLSLCAPLTGLCLPSRWRRYPYSVSFWREPELLSSPRSHMWRVSLKHFLQKTLVGFRTCSVYHIIERRRRRRWHPTPVLLPGKSHGRRSLVGCSPWGHRVGHDWATSLSLFTFMHWRRKWQPTPVFLPGESQGRGSLVGCRR